MFETIVISLETSLREFDECLRFFENSFILRPRLSDMIAWERLDDNAKNLAQSYINMAFGRPDVIYCALFVEIHATFEQYVRDLVEESIRKMNESIKDYDRFSETIVKNNIRYTGSILATIHQPLDYYNFNYNDMCVAIGTCYPGSTSIKLNPSAFSFSAGTMTPVNIENLLKRTTVKIDWDAFGRDRSLQEIFELKKKVRATSKEVKSYMEKMVKLRNRIAHTGATVAEINASYLSMQLKFIKAFSNVLTFHTTEALNRNFGIP